MSRDIPVLLLNQPIDRNKMQYSYHNRVDVVYNLTTLTNDIQVFSSAENLVSNLGKYENESKTFIALTC